MKKLTRNPKSLAIVSVLTAVAAGMACSSSDETPKVAPDEEEVFNESTEGEGYDGATKGGIIPRSDGGEPELPEASADVDTRCCNVTLSIDDPTGDETTARVVGDFGPIAGAGLPLTYADGKWSANACIPVASFVRYRFTFGQKLIDPDDDDGGVEEDSRHEPNVESESDGAGRRVNVFGPVTNCADVDASTGKNK